MISNPSGRSLVPPVGHHPMYDELLRTQRLPTSGSQSDFQKPPRPPYTPTPSSGQPEWHDARSSLPASTLPEASTLGYAARNPRPLNILMPVSADPVTDDPNSLVPISVASIPASTLSASTIHAHSKSPGTGSSPNRATPPCTLISTSSTCHQPNGKLPISMLVDVSTPSTPHKTLPRISNAENHSRSQSPNCTPRNNVPMENPNRQGERKRKRSMSDLGIVRVVPSELSIATRSKTREMLSLGPATLPKSM